MGTSASRGARTRGAGSPVPGEMGGCTKWREQRFSGAGPQAAAPSLETVSRPRAGRQAGNPGGARGAQCGGGEPDREGACLGAPRVPSAGPQAAGESIPRPGGTRGGEQSEQPPRWQGGGNGVQPACRSGHPPAPGPSGTALTPGTDAAPDGRSRPTEPSSDGNFEVSNCS